MLCVTNHTVKLHNIYKTQIWYLHHTVYVILSLLFTPHSLQETLALCQRSCGEATLTKHKADIPVTWSV